MFTRLGSILLWFYPMLLSNSSTNLMGGAGESCREITFAASSYSGKFTSTTRRYDQTCEINVNSSLLPDLYMIILTLDWLCKGVESMQHEISRPLHLLPYSGVDSSRAYKIAPMSVFIGRYK